MAARDINRLFQTTANLRRWDYGPRGVDYLDLVPGLIRRVEQQEGLLRLLSDRVAALEAK